MYVWGGHVTSSKIHCMIILTVIVVCMYICVHVCLCVHLCVCVSVFVCSVQIVYVVLQCILEYGRTTLCTLLSCLYIDC